jgi:Tfp pilus assembly protein FimV
MTRSGQDVTGAGGRILALPMPYRSPARYLAPAALAAVAIASFVILGSGGDRAADGSDFLLTTTPRPLPPPVSQPAPARRPRPESGPGRTYVVQSGDTFAVIAQRTGVSVEQIQQLNPTADSRNLRVGQTLRLGG